MPDESQYDFKDPLHLTHEEQEWEAQRVESWLQRMTDAELRLARARLADLVEAGWCAELCTLRGKLVHAEIQNREVPPQKRRGILKKLFGLTRRDDEAVYRPYIQAVTNWLPDGVGESLPVPQELPSHTSDET